MARSSRKAAASFSVQQRVKVQFTPARFRLFESTRQLDVARLERAARARFEVGYFESSCCRRAVHAVVKRGKVVKLELEPCKDGAPPPPELRPAIRAAVARLRTRTRRSKSLPVPVKAFLSEASAFLIDIWTCFRICCFGYCLFCCFEFSSGFGTWSHCEIEKLGGLKQL